MYTDLLNTASSETISHISKLKSNKCTIIDYKYKNEFIYVLYRNKKGDVWCGTGVQYDETGTLITMSFVSEPKRDIEQNEIYANK